jgi:hypothetical protein
MDSGLSGHKNLLMNISDYGNVPMKYCKLVSHHINPIKCRCGINGWLIIAIF